MAKMLDGKDFLYIGLGVGALYAIYKLTKPVTDATQGVAGVVQDASGAVSSIFKTPANTTPTFDAMTSAIPSGLKALSNVSANANPFDLRKPIAAAYDFVTSDVKQLFPTTPSNSYAQVSYANQASYATNFQPVSGAAVYVPPSGKYTAPASYSPAPLYSSQPKTASSSSSGVKVVSVTPVKAGTSFFDKPIRVIDGKNTRNY